MDFNDVEVVGLVVSIWSQGTNIGGIISSSDGVCGSWETAVEVTTFLFWLFSEKFSSDNMGNKEFSVGVFSIKEGTSLTRFPTIEEVREVFLLIPYEYDSKDYKA